MLRQYVDLPRTVHILCLGTLINRAGAFVVLFLTFYLQERLKLGGIFATQAIGVFGLGTLLAALVGGQLADTIGRKTVMIGALLSGGAVLVTFPWITRPWTILAAVLSFSFLSEMYRPAAQAMMSDVVDGTRRPHAYGLMYMAINLGAGIAPLIGGFLATRAFELLFWGDAATSAVYAIIIALFVKESLTRKTSKEQVGVARETAWQSYGRVFRDRTYLRFCAGTLLLSCSYMQAMSTLPLYMKGLLLGPDVYGWCVAINGLMIVALQVPMTHLIAKFPRRSVIMVASTIVGVGFGLTAVSTTPTAIAATIVIWTLGELMNAPLVPSIVSDLAPADLRARYFGLLTMCFSGGNLIAAPIGGWVLVRFGPQWLWGGCVGVGLLSAVLYSTVRVPIRSSRQ